MLRRLLVAGLLLASACAALPERDERWPESPDGSVARHGAFFLISAAGAPDAKATSTTQRRSTSRDAAILEARARLFDYLRRIMIGKGVSVGERATEDEGWRKRLESAMSGVEVAETKWDEDDRAAVVLRVEKAAVEQALGLDE